MYCENSSHAIFGRSRTTAVAVDQLLASPLWGADALLSHHWRAHPRLHQWTHLQALRIILAPAHSTLQRIHTRYILLHMASIHPSHHIIPVSSLSYDLTIAVTDNLRSSWRIDTNTYTQHTKNAHTLMHTQTHNWLSSLLDVIIGKRCKARGRNYQWKYGQ